MQKEHSTELDLLRQRVAELEAEQERLHCEVQQTTQQYQRLFRAVEQSPVSIVITDALGTILYTNPRFSQLTGYTPDEAIGQNSRLVKSGKTPPEVYQSMWSTILSGQTWEGEFINKKKNGELYCEAARISALVDADGQVTNFVAVKEDITARKQAEAALARHDRAMATLYQNSLEINSHPNLDSLLQATIDRACMLLETKIGMLYLTSSDGQALEIHAGHNLPGSFCGERIVIGQGVIGRVLESGAPVNINDYDSWPERLPIFSSSPPRRVLGIPLKVSQKVIGALALVDHSDGAFSSEQVLLLELFADQAAIAVENARLIEQLSQYNQLQKEQLAENEAMRIQLRDQAIRDPLTGLYNRRYLQETMERETARCNRSRSPLSILMIDIDRFKRINDTFGHQAGDDVLRTLARMLRCHLRLGDIVCRYGGEEFLVVMPGASAGNAFARAEQIREAFAKEVIRSGGEEIHATISTGVAVYPQHGQTGEDVLIRADRALYWAKESGRNQTVLYQTA